MRGQDAAVLARARLLLRFKHDRARAIAEQHAGGAVGPVEMREKVSIRSPARVNLPEQMRPSAVASP
jgi:hypothetical protein